MEQADGILLISQNWLCQAFRPQFLGLGLKCRRFVLWMRQYQNIIVHSVYINFINWQHLYKARHLGQTWSCSLPADTDDLIADGWWRTNPGRCGSRLALVPSSTATGIMSSMAMITVTDRLLQLITLVFIEAKSLCFCPKKQVLIVDFQRERPWTD